MNTKQQPHTVTSAALMGYLEARLTAARSAKAEADERVTMYPQRAAADARLDTIESIIADIDNGIVEPRHASEDEVQFVTDMQIADEAMQAALRSCPARDLALKNTQGTFESVRATLVMAYGLQREAEATG